MLQTGQPRERSKWKEQGSSKRSGKVGVPSVQLHKVAVYLRLQDKTLYTEGRGPLMGVLSNSLRCQVQMV